MDIRGLNKIIRKTGMVIILILLAACSKDTVTPDTSSIKITPVTVRDLNAAKISVSMFPTDSISVYPNPFQTRTYLQVSGLTNEPVEVKISDENGNFQSHYKQISSGTIYIMVDLSDLPEGGYLCDILVGNDILRTELLKIKN